MAEYIIQETTNFNETRRLATDDEICERFPHHIVFGIDMSRVLADSTTTVIIRLQLVSLPLSDDTRRPIHQSRPITVVPDEGESFVIELDERGYGEFPCAFAAPGEYYFGTDGIIYSDGITIEAVQ